MKNFTRKEDLDVLMREFQEHQTVYQAAEDDQKKKYEAYQKASEYRALCEEYRKLFSKMLKEMLNITKPADADKIRLNYSQKLAPVLQKLKAFSPRDKEESKTESTTPTATLQSREGVAEGLNTLNKLVSAVEALKTAIPETEADTPQST